MQDIPNENEDGFELLKMRIVEQAVTDLVTAYSFQRKHKGMNPKSKKAIEMERLRVDCESFFRGQWFTALCELDGEKIIGECKRKALKGGR